VSQITDDRSAQIQTGKVTLPFTAYDGNNPCSDRTFQERPSEVGTANPMAQKLAIL
jgi:hypothetical protein